MTATHTGVFSAIHAGDLEFIKSLPHASLHLELTNSIGMMPLHLAAELGHADIAMYLIEQGADIHAFDSGGRTPLLVAAEYGRVEVAELLLKKGATPAARAKSSETALHLAVKCTGHSADPQGMTELLARHKYLLDYRLSDGRTALMITAADENLGMMLALINAGADQGLRDDQKRSAADWAREKGATRTFNILVDREGQFAHAGLKQKMRIGHALKLKLPKIQ